MIKVEHHLPEEDSGYQMMVQMIADHLCPKIVFGYLKRNPQHVGHSADMISHSMALVVELYEKNPLLTMDSDSLKYISKAVSINLWKYINAIPVVHRPQSTEYELFVAAGKEHKKIVIINEVGDERTVIDYNEEDVLASIAENDQERFILGARHDGMKSREIAEALGLTEGRISQILSVMKRRWFQ